MPDERAYHAILDAPNRLDAIREASDETIVHAMRAASQARDTLLATLLAEEALDRLRRVRTVAAVLPEGLLVLDAEARLNYVNDAALRLFGATREQAIGALPMTLIERLDRDGRAMGAGEWTVRKVLDAGEPLRDEAWFRRLSDGALFSAAFTITPLVHESKVVGAVALFSDTTLQKTDAAEPDAELKALAAVARRTPDLLTRSRADGAFFWASPSSYAVLGYAPSEMADSSFVKLAHPHDAAHVAQLLRMALEPDMPPLEAILRMRRKDGGYVWVHLRVQGVAGPGRVVHELVASTRPLHPRPGSSLVPEAGAAERRQG